MWGFAPALTRLGRDMGFVPLVMTSCIVLYAASWLVDPQVGRGFSFLAPTNLGITIFGASGRFPVVELGRWWTLLTASWLHGNLIHIAVNMMSVRNVAPIVADFYGASRMIIIYVVGGVIGFGASTLAGMFVPPNIPIIGGGALTVGASASIAGLIGAVFFYGRRTGSSAVSDQAKVWIMMFLLMGVAFQNIDNWGHLGGLAGGYLCAKFLDPLYPERLDHFMIALGSLVLTAIAIIVSAAHAYWLLRS
jgi:rhomboid protease GluP